jgi:hypothetical protein
LEDFEENIDIEKYYFINDYHHIWEELNKQVVDQQLISQFQDSSNTINLMAEQNRHFVSIFNTKSQKVIYSTDNLHDVLGMSCSNDDYKNRPVYFWLKNSGPKQAWYLMQLSMLFKNEIKDKLKNQKTERSLHWYHHNTKHNYSIVQISL